MERAASQRRREIECELMQLEVDVWKDLNREQQALVDAEQRKTDQFTEAVIQARVAFHQEVFDTENKLRSAKLSRHHRGETTSAESKSQQTQHLTVGSEFCGVSEELEALREEVRVLEEAACLLDQHKRLAVEPLEGDDFKRLQEALSAEEEFCLGLRKQIGELEEAMQASLRPGQPAVATAPTDFSWITDPWDQEPEEATNTPSRTSTSASKGHPTPTAGAHGTPLRPRHITAPPPPPPPRQPLQRPPAAAPVAHPRPPP